MGGASLRRLFVLGVAASLMAGAGCNKAAPKPDAVAVLKERKAIIETDAEGRVIGVDLDPASDGDADLALVKDLPHVRTLDATEVRGVTDKGLEYLEGHPGLRALKLERSSVTDAGMPYLQKIPNLEDLDIRRLGITVAGYNEIGKITGLKRLRVVYNSLNFKDECLLAIKDLKNLELLDMQDCNLPTEKGLVVLQGFPKLRNLRMYGPNVNDKVLSYLKGAKDLRVLSLEQCSGITPAGFDEIKGMNNLTELALYGALQTTDAAVAKLGGLTKLQKLELRSTPISSLALSYVKDLKNLKVLDLSETAAVGNEGLEYIKGLKSLEELYLWSCQIDDNGLASIEGLTNLKRLNLDKCQITDDGLAHLEPLKNLEFLHIGSTQVTDAGLEHLYGLKKLKTLEATYLPGVSSEGIEALKKKLPQLEEVKQ
jgi:Leucine Rich Repeat (LRR) protein